MSSSEKFNPQAGPETAPFGQPVTIYDSWSGNPAEPTDEERAESERNHARLMAATHEAVNKMVQDFDDLTNEDRYRRVKEFILVRRKQWYDQVQNNCATEGGKAAFDALAGLSTDSTFLNRLIDWGMSREAH